MRCINGNWKSSNVFSTLLILLRVFSTTSAALFDGCNHMFYIDTGFSYLESPYYPDNYVSGSSCRYKFIAPLDYEIEVNCTIHLDRNTDACSSEYVFVAYGGESLLGASEEFCGSGEFVRKSFFNKLVVAYASYGTIGSGRFRCSLYATPQLCDCGWSDRTEIDYDPEVDVTDYPSMVALKDLTSDLPTFCDGVIISHRFILTATHCTRQQPNPANIIAYVGDHNLEASDTETLYAAKYTISEIYEHPGYQTHPVTNDIALLQTTYNIEWSRGVGPICLPITNTSDNFAYAQVEAIGWNINSSVDAISTNLQKFHLIVANNTICQQSYQAVTTIESTQFCAYDYTGIKRDSCQYDSGGPVIMHKGRQFLLGLISFGKIFGEGGYAMGVNTRITSYLDWIHQTTSYATCDIPM